MCIRDSNRGSVDYLQKKFLSALARLLKERDEAEGKCRLRPVSYTHLDVYKRQVHARRQR